VRIGDRLAAKPADPGLVRHQARGPHAERDAFRTGGDLSLTGWPCGSSSVGATAYLCLIQHEAIPRAQGVAAPRRSLPPNGRRRCGACLSLGRGPRSSRPGGANSVCSRSCSGRPRARRPARWRGVPGLRQDRRKRLALRRNAGRLRTSARVAGGAGKYVELEAWRRRRHDGGLQRSPLEERSRLRGYAGSGGDARRRWADRVGERGHALLLTRNGAGPDPRTGLMPGWKSRAFAPGRVARGSGGGGGAGTRAQPPCRPGGGSPPARAPRLPARPAPSTVPAALAPPAARPRANAWARLLEERRAAGARLLGLSETNPTRVGLGGAPGSGSWRRSRRPGARATSPTRAAAWRRARRWRATTTSAAPPSRPVTSCSRATRASLHALFRLLATGRWCSWCLAVLPALFEPARPRSRA